MYSPVKKELAAIPLDELFYKLSEASALAKETALDEAIRIHKRNMDNDIAIKYANREDSYEGNIDQDYPFDAPKPKVIAAKQAAARKLAFSEFATKHKLTTISSWFLPQLAAHIAKIPLVTTPEGLISTVDYIEEFKKDDFHKGIWSLGLHPVRGDLVPKQYTQEGRSYCALVPLLLMPHKRFNNISYSSWNKLGLSSVVDSSLYEAMTLEYDVTNTTEELLEIRNTGLTVQTGKTAGSMRNAVSTHKLYSLPGKLNTLPWLAQAMIFQIWCAHPTNRSDLMILDWKDWDRIPEPLVPVQLFEDPKAEKAEYDPYSLFNEPFVPNSKFAKASSTYKVEKDPYSLF
jgi:hypothetical protein